MKLRIHENSLRIRVNRPDLELLQRAGSIEHRVNVAAGAALVYRLKLVESGSICADLNGSTITVCLPRPMAERWFDESEVAVAGTQQTGATGELRLLIEKDFACLVPREGEDQEGYFSNPARAGE